MEKVTFVTAESDRTSVKKATDFFERNGIDNCSAKWITIPRSREVKQSYLSSILSTLKAFVYAFFLIALRHR